MDYCDVLTGAVARVIGAFDDGRITLHTEAELRAWLFCECAKELAGGQETPMSIHAEHELGEARADLLLGPRPNVAVELKLQTPSGNSIWLKETGGSHSIEGDIKKIGRYAGNGICGHFLMVEVDDGTDEDYYWPKYTTDIGVPLSDWREGRRCAWLHKETKPHR